MQKGQGEKMFLIEPVKRCLEIVQTFKGLKREQLYFLHKKEFPARNPNMDIDKLVRMKLIEVTDDTVHVPSEEYSSDMQDAADILIAFWSKNIISYTAWKPPVLLRFSRLMKGGVRNFYVCKDENVSALRLFDSDAFAVVITDNKDLRCLLPCDYILAVRENGKYNIHKPNKQGGV
jgi:hypothetical protein